MHHGKHRRASLCLERRRKRGQQNQALGRSRGGFSCKIHLKTDFDGLSLALIEAMHAWLIEQLNRVSGRSGLAQAMRYALNHWAGLILFLKDGRLELDTNTVERAIRPVVLTRKNSLFAGSDSGARHRGPSLADRRDVDRAGEVEQRRAVGMVDRCARTGRLRAHEKP